MYYAEELLTVTWQILTIVGRCLLLMFIFGFVAAIMFLIEFIATVKFPKITESDWYAKAVIISSAIVSAIVVIVCAKVLF